MKQLVPAFCLSLLLLPFGTQPIAAAVSEWASVHGGAVRLIAAGPPANGTYSVGVEFSLEPGWHTYWRFPGEAGIPPDLDFSASRNVKSTEVFYPVPERYFDGFSHSIVYHDAVVLPLNVTPADETRPADLTVSLFFGICKDICVPGEATLTLRLSPDADFDKLSSLLIERDLALVPGSPTPDAPKVTEISAETSDDQHRLMITARLGSGVDTDLFAEGPEGSYIALPVLKEQSNGKAVWTLSTKGLARTDGGSRLTFVLRDGDRAVEQTFDIPAVLLPADAN
ncbi:protein-disulfide reductase DsbD domain-containing protein [Roseibium sp.]|uniref:protein-disulfide reductase DsbD domain-containing protein n=1 Tax=Roseibium sp. TaxID=1936156 RepID=UPI003A9787C5